MRLGGLLPIAPELGSIGPPKARIKAKRRRLGVADEGSAAPALGYFAEWLRDFGWRRSRPGLGKKRKCQVRDADPATRARSRTDPGCGGGWGGRPGAPCPRTNSRPGIRPAFLSLPVRVLGPLPVRPVRFRRGRTAVSIARSGPRFRVTFPAERNDRE